MLLIDADLLLHRTAAVTERDIDWGDEVSTIHCDHKEMQALAKREIAKIIAGCGLPHVKVILVFSGDKNFRKELDPSYKANRTGRKPVGYKVLKEWLFKNYESKFHQSIEADDLMGIMQTSGKLGKTVIVSDDKDMLQIPGLVYRPTEGVTHSITPEKGEWHHMMQTLCGDKADNYPGLPGCGEKTAEKILSDEVPGSWWTKVVKAYEARGLTFEDALLQARLSKILHAKDYDLKNRKPILWTPPTRKPAPTVTSTSTSPAQPKKSSETALAPVTSPAVTSPAPTRTKRTRKTSTSPTTTPSTK